MAFNLTLRIVICTFSDLCILLAGDIATNPGPVCNSTTLGLKVLYLNARSLKALVHGDWAQLGTTR